MHLRSQPGSTFLERSGAMRTLFRSGLLAAAAGALLVVVGSSPGQDGKPADKAADKLISGALRDVINQGADLFNLQGDVAGCYRVFQGGLIAVKPLLGHHADLQKAIDDGLARAERLPRVVDRAFALRKVIDDIRDKLG